MGAIAEISKILYANMDLGTFGLPVAYEGLDFDAKGQAAYLSCFVLRAPTLQAELGPQGCDAHTGIFQIDVNYREGQGATALLEKADEVNAYFYSGRYFESSEETVNIRNVSASRLNIAGGWSTINLTIEYQVYSKRI